MPNDYDMVNPVSGIRGFTTEYAAAILVLAALALLVMVRRGFRGVGVPGVASVNLG